MRTFVVAIKDAGRRRTIDQRIYLLIQGSGVHLSLQSIYRASFLLSSSWAVDMFVLDD